MLHALPVLWLLASRSLAASGLRTALTGIAVVLGVAAIMGSLSAIGAIDASLNRAAADAAGGADLEVRALAEHGFPLGVVEQARGVDGVVLATPTLEKRTYMRSERLRGFVHLVGLELAGRRQKAESSNAEPDGLLPSASRLLAAGRWPERGEEAVALIGAWASGQGIGLGHQLELITRNGFRPFEVVGLLSEAGLARRSFGRVVFVSLETAQQLFGMGDRVTHLSLKLERPDQRERVARELANVLPGGFAALRPDEIGRELRTVSEQLSLGLLLFGVTALYVGAFLIHNTISMTVAEQRRQIGLLRAAGVTREQVLAVVLLQVGVIGAVGSILGALAGAGLARWITAWLATGEGLGPLDAPLSPGAAALSVAVGLSTALLSGALPAWRASSIAPAEALRSGTGGPPVPPGMGSWLVVLGLAVAGLAVLLWPLPSALCLPPSTLCLPPSAFRLLAVLLWLSAAGGAAAGLVGPLSRLCALPFRWLFGAEGRLAELNLRRGQHRAGLTVVGFTASLALIVALSTLGSSFTTAGQERIAGLLAGELLVVSPVAQPMRLAEEFRQLPGVARVTPLRAFSVASGATWLDAMAIEPDDYADQLGVLLLEGDPGVVLDSLRAGQSVLAPIRVAQARGLRNGDRLALLTTQGSVEFQIVGLLAHSFPSSDNMGTIVLSRQDVARYFGLDSFSFLAVAVAAGVSAEAVEGTVAEVAERFGMELVTVRSVRSAIQGGVGRLLGLFGSLVAIGSVVAGLGIVNTMMMNVAERRRELGVLRALGLTRAQVQVMVLSEAGMMGLIGGLLGVLVGLGLGRLLLELARSPDFNPQPVWPVGAAVFSVLAAVLVAMLAALPPARAAAQMRISRALFGG